MEPTEDVIMACLDSAPKQSEALGIAFSLLKQIWNALGEVQSMKEQLTTLTGTIASLLQTLKREHRSERLVAKNTAREIDKLDCLLKDVLDFVKLQTDAGFLKGLLRQNDSIKAIQKFHRQIDSVVQAFNISALLDVQAWQARDAAARSKDQEALHSQLSVLEGNQNELAALLNAQHTSVMGIMISLQRCLNEKSTHGPEQRFIQHSLRYLASTSQERVQIDSWTITSFEVEFGDEIGSGGFGQVYRGTWNKTQVALKVLKAQEGGIPSSVAIRKEIEMWSNLRHPHVLQFLGANIVDSRPFIVMPLLRNGNARDYITAHPSCDRIKILRDVSLGLVHLHSHRVIHGDLKALNVLIDDGHNALLCDFGLSRLKEDAVSRSTTSANSSSSVFGSRNWMSPERILGGALRKPVDIYAFGMTIYEIMTTEIPLGHISTATDFLDLVTKLNVRPERPEEEDCPDLSDDLWGIAECCWAKNPKERPDAATLCDEMERCLASHREAKGTPISFPPPPKLEDSLTRRSQVDSSPQPILEQRDRPVTRVTSLPSPPKVSAQPSSSSIRRAQHSPPTSISSLRPADVNWIKIDSSEVSAKHSPQLTMPHQSYHRDPYKRPLTMEELAVKAQQDLWDEKESLGHYLTIASKCRNEGNRLQVQGDLEGAYVQFSKAAALILGEMPHHREYKLLTQEKQANLSENGKFLTDKLDELRPTLVHRLDKYNQYGRY